MSFFQSSSDPSCPSALLFWLVPDVPLRSSCRLNIPQLETAHRHTDRDPHKSSSTYTLSSSLPPLSLSNSRSCFFFAGVGFFFLKKRKKTQSLSLKELQKNSSKQEGTNAIRVKRTKFVGVNKQMKKNQNKMLTKNTYKDVVSTFKTFFGSYIQFCHADVGGFPSWGNEWFKCCNYPVRESSKAFTTHRVKNISWNRLSILPVKCTEKETPSSRGFRRERSSSETAESAPDVEPEESKGLERSSKA